MTSPYQSEGDDGGKGGVLPLRASQVNRFVGMMLNPFHRWKTTEEIKDKALQATVENIESGDPRTVNTAVANLLKMEAQNQTDELKALDKQIPDATNATPLPLADAIHEPQYLEYLEATHMAADRHARTVGNVGIEREVETGETPASPEQGTD